MGWVMDGTAPPSGPLENHIGWTTTMTSLDEAGPVRVSMAGGWLPARSPANLLGGVHPLDQELCSVNSSALLLLFFFSFWIYPTYLYPFIYPKRSISFILSFPSLISF